MCHSIVYVSTATRKYNNEELEALLRECREWNKRAGLTGLLLYKDWNFMQFLEGPKDAVLEILAKIKKDPRHHSMIVLVQKEEAEREFATWSMAFERINSEAEAPPTGFTDLWELPFTSEEFLIDPTRSLQFLLSFKKVAC